MLRYNKKIMGLQYTEDLEELFVDVQSQWIFADQKTFADSHAKFSVDQILSAYRKEKDEPGFDLKAFCARQFDIPVEQVVDFKSDTNNTAEEHIALLWTHLTKRADEQGGTLIPLPNNFVVPGGRFREFFYWDSYFTMLGLQVSKSYDLIVNMINNFAYLINTVGFIPNGNRTYFLSRSQPPFFSLMIDLLSEIKGEGVYLEYLHQLQKEYEFWMRGEGELDEGEAACERVVKMPDGEVLNRYWDELNTPRPESYAIDVEDKAKAGNDNPELYRDIRAACESGWDFSSRWFRDNEKFNSIHTTQIIPVDLNCLLYHLEQTLEKAYRLKNDHELAGYFKSQAENRRTAIQKYLWNTRLNAFCDYDKRENLIINKVTIATAYPLFLNLANNTQAEMIANVIERDFLKQGGVLTTLFASGQQWDAPNGWAPLQWVTYKGLLNYGFNDLANTIKTNWTQLVERVFEKTGGMKEKYNVVDTSQSASGGEYPNQDGFGWTNGIYLKMKQKS